MFGILEWFGLILIDLVYIVTFILSVYYLFIKRHLCL